MRHGAIRPILLAGLLGALCLQIAPAAAVVGAQDLPSIPEPVAIDLDAATTALLVLDMASAGCLPRPTCAATVPSVESILGRARAAGAFVVYSSTPAFGAAIIPELAPRPDDPLVTTRADKFYGTDLPEILDTRGIRTLLVVGTASNGAILYTSFGANLRGYTVVVAEDGISAPTDFATLLTRWQLLNQPGFDNPDNKPLEPGRVTLSRTDLVTFR